MSKCDICGEDKLIMKDSGWNICFDCFLKAELDTFGVDMDKVNMAIERKIEEYKKNGWLPE